MRGHSQKKKEVRVKQGVRFFVKPSAFVNQLQWSSHHTWILILFAAVAALEAHIGRNHLVVEKLATALSYRLGIGQEIGMWLMVSLKLLFTLAISYVISIAIWFVGSFLGRSSSQRVLFRRLSVVFTLALIAHTAQHLTHLYPWVETARLFTGAWAVLLGFFTLKEQFRIGFLETVFVAGFTALLITSSWHYSHRFLARNAHSISQEIAYRPLPFLKSAPQSKKKFRR